MFSSYELGFQTADFGNVFTVENAVRADLFKRSSAKSIICDSALQRIVGEVNRAKSATNKARKALRDAGSEIKPVTSYDVVREMFNPGGLVGFPLRSQSETEKAVYALYQQCSKALGWTGGYSPEGFKTFIDSVMRHVVEHSAHSDYIDASEVFIGAPNDAEILEEVIETAQTA